MDCILVDFWAKVGTISTTFFADMLYKLSCPFSERVHDFCYTNTALSLILLLVSIFLELVVSIVMFFFVFFFYALTLTMVECWAVNM